MFMGEIGFLPSVVMSETWQHIRKAKGQEMLKTEERKFRKKQFGAEGKLFDEKAKTEKKTVKFRKKKS